MFLPAPDNLRVLSTNYIHTASFPDGTGSVLHISILLAGVLCLAIHFMLQYTTFGRNIYAIGDDVVAAQRAGIKVSQVRLVLFIIAGIICGIGGVVHDGLARCTVPMPSDIVGDELTIIAAVVLGVGTAKQARGSVAGTLLGVVFLRFVATNTKVRCETVAAMARIIGELMDEIQVPFGVNVLWDPVASLDLAAATDAKFAREIFTGVYASDFELWNTNCGEAVRHQRAIGAENVKLLFNIVPEAAQYVSARDIQQVAKSTVFNCRPDALCVSGLTAGAETDAGILELTKQVAGGTSVFSNTGCRTHNIAEQLTIADGAVVGTTFKVDGKFENLADAQRVKEFMDVVKAFHKNK